MGKLNFPLYLLHARSTYAVKGYIDDYSYDEFKDGKGYVVRDSGNIYIYDEYEAVRYRSVPRFRIEDDKIKFYVPHTQSVIDYFNVTNTKQLNLDTIIENTDPNEELYNEKALEDMNAATSIYRPIINENDDVLKKIVKTAILTTGIDINSLKHKMGKRYGLSNLRQALSGKTKMSINHFNIWFELLDLGYTIIVNGLDPNASRLGPNSIMYTSIDNKIRTVDIHGNEINLIQDEDQVDNSDNEMGYSSDDIDIDMDDDSDSDF